MLDNKASLTRFNNYFEPVSELLTRGMKLDLSAMQILDVGAGNGTIALALQQIKGAKVAAIDSHVREEVSFPVEKFDGRNIPFRPNSFDMSLFMFVLHHASTNMISLLQEAIRVSRHFIVVAEDFNETRADYHACMRHDPKGLYLSRQGWKELFKAMELELLFEGSYSHFFNHPVHRGFFILKCPGMN